jgi:uncharacterized membrane protein
MMDWNNDGWGGGGSWAGMGLMMLFSVALLGLAVWAGVHFLRANGPTVAAGASGPTPRAVLDQRLAAGEIDAEHYAQVRRLLDGQSAGTAPTDPPAPEHG